MRSHVLDDSNWEMSNNRETAAEAERKASVPRRDGQRKAHIRLGKKPGARRLARSIEGASHWGHGQRPGVGKKTSSSAGTKGSCQLRVKLELPLGPMGSTVVCQRCLLDHHAMARTAPAVAPKHSVEHHLAVTVEVDRAHLKPGDLKRDDHGWCHAPESHSA